MRAGVSDRGYRAAAAFIERLTGAVDADPIDHEALAVILIGAVVNLRRSTWTFGAAPLGIDDQRFIDTFTALVTTLLDLRPS